VLKNGYSLQKHAVNTPDGWRLNMYRIPHGKGQQPGPRPVVLLHHGITLSSACFTLLQPNESMAYVFADAGEPAPAAAAATGAVAYCCAEHTGVLLP
jgi:hypothetical protein